MLMLNRLEIPGDTYWGHLGDMVRTACPERVVYIWEAQGGGEETNRPAPKGDTEDIEERRGNSSSSSGPQKSKTVSEEEARRSLAELGMPLPPRTPGNDPPSDIDKAKTICVSNVPDACTAYSLELLLQNLICCFIIISIIRSIKSCMPGFHRA